MGRCINVGLTVTLSHENGCRAEDNVQLIPIRQQSHCIGISALTSLPNFQFHILHKASSLKAYNSFYPQYTAILIGSGQQTQPANPTAPYFCKSSVSGIQQCLQPTYVLQESSSCNCDWATPEVKAVYSPAFPRKGCSHLL